MNEQIEIKLNKLNQYQLQNGLPVFGLCRNSYQVIKCGSIVANFKYPEELEAFLDQELKIYE